MKKIYVLFFALNFYFSALAQERIEKIMLLGTSDAKKIFTAYVAPIATVAGFTQSEGWFNSAQPLNAGKINFQIIGNVTPISENKYTFNLKDLNLSNAEVVQGGPPTSPSAIGSGNGTEVVGRNGERFNLFNGSGLGVIPMPALQLNIGFIKNTEISLRGVFLPISTSENTLDARFYGVAVKHDIKQWIPSIALANFSWSAFGSYTIGQAGYSLSIKNVPGNPNDQSWNFRNRTLSFGTILSKHFNLLTLMTGLRHSISTTRMDLAGTYLVGAGLAPPVITKDPFSQDFKESDTSLMIGAKLRLGWFFITLNGSIGKYPSASIGLGFGKNKR